VKGIRRVVAALSEENRAIIAQGRAVDSYNAYEAKEIRYTIYQALIAGGVIHDRAALGHIKGVAAGETIMRSYETLQLATASVSSSS
jgi:hypothetical protein